MAVAAVQKAWAWLEEQQKEWADEPLGEVLLTAINSATRAKTCWEVQCGEDGAGDRLEKDHAVPALKELDHLHQLCWSKLHRPEADAPDAAGLTPWREVFALCCFMRCELMAGEAANEFNQRRKSALRLADLGLIVGGPDTQMSPYLQQRAEHFAKDLSSRFKRTYEGESCWLERSMEVHSRSPSVEVASPLSMERFLVSYFAPKVPVTIRRGCASWPAIRRWREEAFWTSGALGQRFVPVETDYWMDEGFNIQQLKDFIQHCKAPGTQNSNPSKGGYLAQHALFDQLPALEADILTPDLALCGESGTVLRQVFFGPKGTVTPLHWDPYENIFCQVVGVKYLRLFAPSQSEKLYPREGDMKNNSRVQPVDISLGDVLSYQENFPEFLAAEFQDMVLEPGDMLYLPLGWWHFVKSLSTSISVAFHFT